MTIVEKLDSIRKAIDIDITKCDIESVVEKGKNLSQLIGLSAECKSQTRRNLEQARLSAIQKLLVDKLQPSVLLKMADAMCECIHHNRVISGSICMKHLMGVVPTMLVTYKIENGTCFEQQSKER